jgi:hypothetical protein
VQCGEADKNRPQNGTHDERAEISRKLVSELKSAAKKSKMNSQIEKLFLREVKILEGQFKGDIIEDVATYAFNSIINTLLNFVAEIIQKAVDKELGKFSEDGVLNRFQEITTAIGLDETLLGIVKLAAVVTGGYGCFHHRTLLTPAFAEDCIEKSIRYFLGHDDRDSTGIAKSMLHLVDIGVITLTSKSERFGLNKDIFDYIVGRSANAVQERATDKIR